MGRVRMHSESSVCMVFLIVMLTVCFFSLFWLARTGIQTDVVYLYTYIPKNRHNTLRAVQKKNIIKK